MSDFQHRHYAAIAKVIRERRSFYGSRKHNAERDAVLRVQDDLMLMFGRDNERFDIQRFMDACDPARTPRGKDVR